MKIYWRDAKKVLPLLFGGKVEEGKKGEKKPISLLSPFSSLLLLLLPPRSLIPFLLGCGIRRKGKDFCFARHFSMMEWIPLGESLPPFPPSRRKRGALLLFPLFSRLPCPKEERRKEELNGPPLLLLLLFRNKSSPPFSP